MFEDIDGLHQVGEDKCDHKAQGIGDEERWVDKVDVEISYRDMDRCRDAAGQAITDDLVLQCFLDHRLSLVLFVDDVDRTTFGFDVETTDILTKYPDAHQLYTAQKEDDGGHRSVTRCIYAVNKGL